jgi:hypothetical protein
LVNPANGGKYPPAPPMPAWMTKKRLIEEAQRQQRMTTLQAALANKTLEASASSAAGSASPSTGGGQASTTTKRPSALGAA